MTFTRREIECNGAIEFRMIVKAIEYAGNPQYMLLKREHWVFLKEKSDRNSIFWDGTEPVYIRVKNTRIFPVDDMPVVELQLNNCTG